MTQPQKSAPAPTYLAAVAGLLVTIAVVRYPQEAFGASLDGLRLWFDVVLPALLPFFTLADILMGLGVIHAVGVLLEPLMRPVFRIPGVGGFAVAMGLASGYPLGAKITGRIRRDGLCTREEGERLVSFANTADPLFMIGAVAVGMFSLPQVGLSLAVAHYLAVLVVGFVMRYHASGKMGPPPAPRKEALFGRALDALREARRSDGRPFGELFSDAVKESIQSMLFVGGCIMMFSVLIRILDAAGVTQLMEAPLGAALTLFGFGTELASSLIKGTVEITIGTQDASQAAVALIQKVAAAGAIIGWSGFSVHAQVSAMVYGTDIRIGPYLLARFLHAVLAGVFTFYLFEPLGGAAAAVETALVPRLTAGAPSPMPLVVYWGLMAAIGLGLLLTMLALSLCLHLAGRIRLVVFRVRGGPTS